MPFHTLKPNDRLEADRPGFGIEVSNDDGTVSAPSSLCQTLEQKLSATTLEQFLSLLFSFPSAVAKVLGREIETVVNSRTHLVEKVRGTVAEEYLHQPEEMGVKFGANDPASANGD